MNKRQDPRYTKDGHVSRIAVEALRYVANLQEHKAYAHIPVKYKQNPLLRRREIMEFLGIEPFKKWTPRDCCWGDYFVVSDEAKEKAKAALKELEPDMRREWLI